MIASRLLCFLVVPLSSCAHQSDVSVSLELPIMGVQFWQAGRHRLHRLPLKAGTTTLQASATPANVASASTQAIRAAQKAPDPRRQSIAAGNANRAGWSCRWVM